MTSDECVAARRRCRRRKWVTSPTLKVYPGLSREMRTNNQDQINSDLRSFIKS